jgi:hypothetical protein
MTEPASVITVAAVKDGVEMLDKLGVLDRVRLKLASDPDRASRELSIALAELLAGYTALHSEIVSLSMLDVDEPGRTIDQKLTRLADGSMAAELHSVKGSCARIWNIYERYLTGWFSRALAPQEAAEIRAVFDNLGSSDGAFVLAAEELSSAAQQAAKEALRLRRLGGPNDAARRLATLATQLEPHREALSANMAKLWQLQADFIKMARAV